MANRKLGNLGNIIPSFLISKFLILLGLKNLGKKIPSFPSFRPGPLFGQNHACFCTKGLEGVI